MGSQRIFIYLKDIQALTGKTGRTAQRIYTTLKDSLQKEKHQHITIREYCQYYNISEDEVRSVIK